MTMNREGIRDEFKKRSSIDWTNSQGEPDIDYVYFLEDKIISMYKPFTLYKLKPEWAHKFARIVNGTTYDPHAQVMNFEEWKDFLWKNDEFGPVLNYVEPISDILELT